MDGTLGRDTEPFVRVPTSALNSPDARFMHGQVLAMNGRHDEACEVFDGLHQDAPETFFAKLGHCYQCALRGERNATLEAISSDVRETAHTDPQYSWMVSQCYALVGETTKALDWLHRAVGRGFINYPLLSAWDPLLDKVRTDPRFGRLMDGVREQWEASDA